MALKSGNPPAWKPKNTQAKTGKQERAEDALQKSEEERRMGGLNFWDRFVDRAMLNVQGMPRLKGMQLTGGVSATSAGPVRDCSIQVTRHSDHFGGEQSKMDLSYAPGESQIQCWYQHQRMNNVILVVHRHELHASVAGKLLTAEQLADQIVEWMISQVRAGLPVKT